VTGFLLLRRSQLCRPRCSLKAKRKSSDRIYLWMECMRTQRQFPRHSRYQVSLASRPMFLPSCLCSSRFPRQACLGHSPKYSTLDQCFLLQQIRRLLPPRAR
jgi:hypothetical protein